MSESTVYGRCVGSYSQEVSRYGSISGDWNDDDNKGETFENIRKNNYDGLAVGDFWDIFYGKATLSLGVNASEFAKEDCKWMVNKFPHMKHTGWNSKTLRWFREMQHEFYLIMKDKTDYSNTTQWTDEHVAALKFYEEETLNHPGQDYEASWWFWCHPRNSHSNRPNDSSVGDWATATLTALQAVGRAGATGEISLWTPPYNKRTDFMKRVHEKADKFIKNGGLWKEEDGKPASIVCRYLNAYTITGVAEEGDEHGATLSRFSSEAPLWRYFATLQGDTTTTKDYREIHRTYRFLTMANHVALYVGQEQNFEFVTFHYMIDDEDTCGSGRVAPLHYKVQDDNNDYYVKKGTNQHRVLSKAYTIKGWYNPWKKAFSPDSNHMGAHYVLQKDDKGVDGKTFDGLQDYYESVDKKLLEWFDDSGTSYLWREFNSYALPGSDFTEILNMGWLSYKNTAEYTKKPDTEAGKTAFIEVMRDGKSHEDIFEEYTTAVAWWVGLFHIAVRQNHEFMTIWKKVDTTDDDGEYDDDEDPTTLLDDAEKEANKEYDDDAAGGVAQGEDDASLTDAEIEERQVYLKQCALLLNMDMLKNNFQNKIYWEYTADRMLGPLIPFIGTLQGQIHGPSVGGYYNGKIHQLNNNHNASPSEIINHLTAPKIFKHLWIVLPKYKHAWYQN